MMVMVPNSLRDEINKKLDAALAEADPEAMHDRESYYQYLLEHFDKHGYVPEFTIIKKEPKS